MKKYRANRGYDRSENGPYRGRYDARQENEYYRNTNPYDYQDEFIGDDFDQRPLPRFGGYRDDFNYGNDYYPDYQNRRLRNEYGHRDFGDWQHNQPYYGDPMTFYSHPYEWLQGYGNPNKWGPGAKATE